MKRFALTAILLSGIFLLHAQHQNILITTNASPNEPSIIINPKNTNQLYGGANIASYFYSDDGGYNWQTGTLTSQQYGVWGDPVLLCDTAGAFYFFHLSNPPQGNWIDRIVCQKVEALGGEWNDGTYMGLDGTKAQDKHWAAVDWKTNNIYVTWTQFDEYGTSDPSKFSNIMFSRSFDGGLSWSPAVQINQVSGDCVDEDNTTEGAVPCVGPEGQIYVSWAGPAGLVFDRSYDQGDTWLDEDIFVSDIGGGWAYDIPGIYRANGLPVTSCDTSSGPYRGTIYINWSDQRNGPGDTDVWLVKSTDGGDTWSDLIRVNDDPPGKHQFFTWMTIDQTNGYLYFVFYDRRNHDNNYTDVYMARSTDGGETFTNFQVSEEYFNPNSNIFFGDYTNITAHDNVIRPVWARCHNNQMSIWTAIVDPDAVGIEEEIAGKPPFSVDRSYPNPFENSTVFSFKLHETAPVRLAVYDSYGRLVEVLADRVILRPGKYTFQFDVRGKNLAAGVYYFSLVSNDKVSRQKVVLAN
ncbi:MAG TPA: T9SS type A sorting domain-containing protein [Bacteroidales bacterium]|nr:T9SS type A sorting domain-containing protein [Bacteroidales bacterium]